MHHSSLVKGLQKDSTARKQVLTKRLHVALLMRHMPTLSGVRLLNLILADARRFAEAIHAEFPGKLLAYNCSPSFNWKAKLSDEEIANYQVELGKLGYKFQFVTLAGFHSLNHSMFNLALGYKDRGMAAYSELQQANSLVKPTAIQQLVINVKLELVTLMKWHKSFLVEHHPQQHLQVLLKQNNSRRQNNDSLKPKIRLEPEADF